MPNFPTANYYDKNIYTPYSSQPTLTSDEMKKADFFQEVNEWVKQADQGELRDIAAMYIKDAYKNQCPFLSLQGLGLKTLPNLSKFLEHCQENRHSEFSLGIDLSNEDKGGSILDDLKNMPTTAMDIKVKIYKKISDDHGGVWDISACIKKLVGSEWQHDDAQSLIYNSIKDSSIIEKLNQATFVQTTNVSAPVIPVEKQPDTFQNTAHTAKDLFSSASDGNFNSNVLTTQYNQSQISSEKLREARLAYYNKQPQTTLSNDKPSTQSNLEQAPLNNFNQQNNIANHQTALKTLPPIQNAQQVERSNPNQALARQLVQSQAATPSAATNSEIKTFGLDSNLTSLHSRHIETVLRKQETTLMQALYALSRKNPKDVELFTKMFHLDELQAEQDFAWCVNHMKKTLWNMLELNRKTTPQHFGYLPEDEYFYEYTDANNIKSRLPVVFTDDVNKKFLLSEVFFNDDRHILDNSKYDTQITQGVASLSYAMARIENIAQPASQYGSNLGNALHPNGYIRVTDPWNFCDRFENELLEETSPRLKFHALKNPANIAYYLFRHRNNDIISQAEQNSFSDFVNDVNSQMEVSPRHQDIKKGNVVTFDDFIENGGYLPSGARYNNLSQSPLGASPKPKTIVNSVIAQPEPQLTSAAQKKAIQEAWDKWKAKHPTPKPEATKNA